MAELVEFDAKDYEGLTKISQHTTVRGIITQNGRLAMQCSRDGEYKIPGGGVEQGEDHITCLKREVAEETGLLVKAETVRLLVETEEKRRDLLHAEQIFQRHTYFYTCEVSGESVPLHLTESEIEKGFRFVWATPEEICLANEGGQNAKTMRDTEIIRRIRDGELKVD